MESYKEYSIRCKTCNEQLACYAPLYEDLLNSGLSIEEALNQLGITEWCSRISMMNPTIVTFNMENREVIEGFKSVDAATEADSQNESTIRPVFSPCMSTQQTIQQAAPAVRLPPVPQSLSIKPTTKSGLQTIGVSQPAVRLLPPNVPTAIKPIQQGTKEEVAIGTGIAVNLSEDIKPTKFQEPKFVGLPTINENPLLPKMTVYVGSVGNKAVNITILNGRTYIAR